MELLAGWDRVRRNLVGTFFLQAKAELLEKELRQPEKILLKQLTYSVENLPSVVLEREYQLQAHLDECLEEARSNYANKRNQLSLRWASCSKENELLEKFISNFEQYNAASKAKRKAIDEIHEQYNNELVDNCKKVNKLKKEKAKLILVKEELEKRLEISRGYKDFMEKVVAESKGEFESIEEVIARYHQLMAIRMRHVEKTVNQVEMAFKLEKELMELQQEMKFEEVACKTYLSEMEEYQNRLQISSWRRHDNLLAIKAGLKRELLQAYTPKTVIYNLYMLLCQEMKQPVQFKPHQFQEQLKFIERFLNELRKMLDRTKEAMESPSDVPLLSEKSFKGTHSKRSKGERKK